MGVPGWGEIKGIGIAPISPFFVERRASILSVGQKSLNCMPVKIKYFIPGMREYLVSLPLFSPNGYVALPVPELKLVEG